MLLTVASFNACSVGAPLHLRYRRTTLTPMLYLHDAGPAAPPCAVLKLSCRVRSSTPDIKVPKEGKGRGRAPWIDGALGEVASQALLEALSAEHYGGRGSGAVLSHAGAVLDKVPAECIWRGERLVGAALAYIPGLETTRLDAAVLRRSVRHPPSLRAIAATWILDALILNDDRFGSHNVFAVRGALVELDFGNWNLECGADADGAVRSQARLPLLAHGSLASSSQICEKSDWRRALEATVLMAAAACGGGVGGGGAGVEVDGVACPLLAARMRARLEADPYFALSRESPTMFHSLCCSGKPRVCKPCAEPGAAADDVRLILQTPIDGRCLRWHGATAADYLSSLAASRLAIFLEAAQRRLKSC